MPSRRRVFAINRTPDERGVEGNIFQAYSIARRSASLITSAYGLIRCYSRNQEPTSLELGILSARPKEVVVAHTMSRTGNGANGQIGLQSNLR
jgi:hypothetical protein